MSRANSAACNKTLVWPLPGDVGGLGFADDVVGDLVDFASAFGDAVSYINGGDGL